MTSPTGNVSKCAILHTHSCVVATWHPRRGGFTLIEVLLAASILCVGLIAILGAYQGCATALAAARESLLATVSLENRLDSLRQIGLPGVDSGASGDGDGFRSRVDRVSSAMDGDPDLETVRIAVWRRDGEAESSLTTVALRARGSRK